MRSAPPGSSYNWSAASPTLSKSVRPATPTQNREVLLNLLSLELQAHFPQAGIVSVTLEAEPAQPQTSQRASSKCSFPNRINWSCC